MRLNHFYIPALAITLLLPCGSLFAEESADGASATMRVSDVSTHAADEELTPPAIDPDVVPDPIGGYSDYDPVVGDLTDSPYFDVYPIAPPTVLATRFGWWGVSTSGSRNLVGEWQGLDTSSPFYDVDGLFSDGWRTTDFYATGTENESTMTGLRVYNGPGLTADIEYRRFIHRLGHDPIRGFNLQGTPPDVVNNFANPLPPSNYAYWGEDLNAGEDNAIRVQQLQANFKGKLTENFRWRLNVWGLKKEGQRQSNANTHCFQAVDGNGVTGSYCHNVSRGQRIDWLTMEVEPVIEARFGPVTLEYSRTMRSFQQQDGLVLNDYTGGADFGNAGYDATWGNTVPYGIVPENYTEIDRLKALVELGWYTDLYMLGYIGNTHNSFRDSNRQFGGLDARITHRPTDGLSLTAYGKSTFQDDDRPPVALDTLYGHGYAREPVSAATAPAGWSAGNNGEWDEIPEPVDYQRTKVGLKSRWRPFINDWSPQLRGVAVTSGYEYREIQRSYASYDNNAPGSGLFGQPNTITNSFQVGLEQKWSPSVNVFARYWFVDTQLPLFGITPRATYSLDAAVNSGLPTRENRVEVGSTWTPTDYLMVTSTFWIENSYHKSEYARFNENNYPFVLSAWYAPTQRWSVTGGYANFSNWIDQDITLGASAQVSGGGFHGGEWEVSPSFTSPWRYTGRSDVINLASSYACSERLTVTGGFEYVHSRNVFATPTTPTIFAAATANNLPQPTVDPVTNQITVQPYTDLPTYSEVVVDTYRLNVGLDYLLDCGMSAYVRYNYYDYNDFAMAFNTGEAHMFLGGLSGTF